MVYLRREKKMKVKELMEWCKEAITDEWCGENAEVKIATKFQGELSDISIYYTIDKMKKVLVLKPKKKEKEDNLYCSRCDKVLDKENDLYGKVGSKIVCYDCMSAKEYLNL
jgi:formylmethanofuran dehydrogenase subunit E